MASVDVPNTRITFGRTISLPIVLKTDERSGCCVIIDEFTRECLAIEVARSFTAMQVIDVLQYLFAVRGSPKHIRSDNGPEFVARKLTKWLKQAAVETLFIAPGQPMGKWLRGELQWQAS